ncbi:MAG: ferrous iron transport protein B [Bacteroidetes bacterium RIFOXYA12_FULL_35_11]|nr:MAG: ferrous iron transport protein B [Bacteroidetes bacterium GWF2_35_48]OFY72867.1 MAG: ferrous iron transport protein B [Bacteroidetes bacterium RIFOXYA12_FULL_35_11]OFY95911.1 MAG: ferrous iron transport protein B [Bacteroidetes bacterium RIFOXYC12_FULL_35_7]HBX49654.1 ferrous iron transport protein B [Bacteroidales bacterium]
MKLSELNINEKAIISKIRGRGAFRKRIMEMGFVKGHEVKVLHSAPLKDPIEYEMLGYKISLRRSEADLIEVVASHEEAIPLIFENEYFDLISEIKRKFKPESKNISVALVGNPNSGKTTLFNYASGSREHVGNYSGVTVEAKTARFEQDGYTFELADLPGTYSITAYSPEELYVRNYISEKMPDIVINVVDAANLKRNLYLTTQLIDMDIKVVVALNMYDDLERKDKKLDYEQLGKLLGIPFIPTVASKRKGIKELFEKAILVFEDKDEIIRHIHVNYGHNIEKSIKVIQALIKQDVSLMNVYSSRYLSIKLLEKDKDILNFFSAKSYFSELQSTVNQEIQKLETLFREDTETIIADAKYGFISGALKETYQESLKERIDKTEIIDSFITHRLWGFPVFLFFLFIMFYTTFKLGAYPQEWIEQLVGLLGNAVDSLMTPGILKDLIINGIIGGVGGVIIFLPSILILFLFISFLEDSGYMARAAFIMDKLMHKIGLHGKSFIPMIMGFGCTVPAVMATRTLENRSDRLLTMLITPFMSCSARLPVYILLISAFFPKYPGIMLFTIYLIGILLAIILAIILKKIFFKKEEAPFVMELPPYRVPTLKASLGHMWHKGSQYLRKMGGIILIASVIIWALGYFPRNVALSKDYDRAISMITIEKNSIEKSSAFSEEKKRERLAIFDAEIQKISIEKESEFLEKSYIGQIGHFIEPVMTPLGINWKMSISLLAGIAGKELVVSTLGVLYQTGNTTEPDSQSLIYRMQNERTQNSKYIEIQKITPLSAFAFMIFILIYFPCIAVIAAVKKESESWKWAIFTIFYTTGLAWMVAFVVYQVGRVLL